MTGQSLATKAATFGSQIILAWLLLKEEFGLFGMATTVGALGMLIEWIGTRDVLVQRAKRIHLWLTPALWMSLTIGLLAAAVMLALAPAAAWVYGETRVASLIAVLALRPPLQAMVIPATAYLQTQLRFRALALIGSMRVLTGAGLMVLLALLGFGAYSFVIPVAVAAALQAIVLWIYARPPLHMRLMWRRWRYIIGDSATLTAANLMRAVVAYGDYFVLGLFHSATVVGVYYFAFNLSAQALRMMTANITQVLMPVISHLRHEPERQMQGFLRASEALMAIGLPLCLLNAAIAEPLFGLLFGDKWAASIPIYQVLCMGMAMRMIDGASFAMLKGTGQFRTFMNLSIASSVLFIVPVLVASAWFDSLAVAWMVTLWSSAMGPITAYCAIRSLAGGWRDVLSIYAPPLLVSASAVGFAYLTMLWFVRSTTGGHLVQIAYILIIGGGSYIILLRISSAHTWRSLSQIFERLRRRGRPRSSTAQVLDGPGAPADNP